MLKHKRIIIVPCICLILFVLYSVYNSKCNIEYENRSDVWLEVVSEINSEGVINYNIVNNTGDTLAIYGDDMRQCLQIEILGSWYWTGKEKHKNGTAVFYGSELEEGTHYLRCNLKDYFKYVPKGHYRIAFTIFNMDKPEQYRICDDFYID